MPTRTTRGAVAFAATTKGKATSWDGAAATQHLRNWASSDGKGTKGKMDWTKYRQGFAWYDEKNPEDFASYKLAHHDVVGGKLVVVLAGVQAAGGSVQGARGGVDIPAAALAGVKAHLAEHYRQFGATAPWEQKNRAGADTQVARADHSHYQAVERLTRAAGGAGDGAAEDRIIISTENPVHFPWGDEVLGHGPGEVDMTMATVGLSLLLEHGGPLSPYVDPMLHVGVVRDIVLENRQLTGVPYFTPTPEGQRAQAEYEAGGRLWVSVGRSRGANYKSVVTLNDNGPDQIYITGWMPVEVSMPSVPADPHARTGRAAAGAADEDPPAGEEPAVTEEEEETMPEPKKPGTEAGAAAAAVADPPAGAADGAAVVTRSGEMIPTEQVILNYAQALHLEHRAAEFIAAGLGVKEACAKMLEIRKAEPLDLPSAEKLGLSKREVRSFSVAKLLQQAIIDRDPNRSGTKPEGLEWELNLEIQKRAAGQVQTHGGYFLPLRLEEGVEGMRSARPRELRSMGSQLAGSGAELIFPQRGDLIEILQMRAICGLLGANITSGLTTPVEWPKVTSDMEVGWVGENPSADREATELTFGTVLMSGKPLIGVGVIPRMLAMQAAIDIETRIRTGFANADARAIDRGALRGTGSAHQPLGMINTPGVQSTDWDDDAIYDTLETMLGKIADVDEEDDVFGFATTRLMASRFRRTLEFSAAGSTKIWTGSFNDGTMLGYRAISSNQCGKEFGAGSDEHGLFAGVWNQMEIGLYGAIEFIPDVVTLAGRGMIKLNTWHMGDVIIRHPEAFCICKGAKPVAATS